MRSCLCRGCKNKHTGHAVPWQEGRHGEQTGTITSTGPGVRPCSAWAAVSVPSWRRAELRGQPSCITLMLHLIAWAEVKDLDDSECQISLFCEKKKKTEKEDREGGREGKGRYKSSFLDSFFQRPFILTSWIHFFPSLLASGLGWCHVILQARSPCLRHSAMLTGPFTAAPTWWPCLLAVLDSTSLSPPHPLRGGCSLCC